MKKVFCSRLVSERVSLPTASVGCARTMKKAGASAALFAHVTIILHLSVICMSCSSLYCTDGVSGTCATNKNFRIGRKDHRVPAKLNFLPAAIFAGLEVDLLREAKIDSGFSPNWSPIQHTGSPPSDYAALNGSAYNLISTAAPVLGTASASLLIGGSGSSVWCSTGANSITDRFKFLVSLAEPQICTIA